MADIKRARSSDDDPTASKRLRGEVLAPATTTPNAAAAKSTAGGMTREQIEAIKEEAKKRLEEIRKRGIAGRPPVVNASPSVNPIVNPAAGRGVIPPGPAANMATARGLPANVVQAPMGARLVAAAAAGFGISNMDRFTNMQNLQMKLEEKKPTSLFFDQLGRPIDEKGNLIEITPRENMSTLKINQRKAAEKEKKKANAAAAEHQQQLDRTVLETDPNKNPHFDPNIKVDLTMASRERRKGFNFYEPGIFERQSQQQRAKAHLEKLRRDIEERARRAGMDQLVDASVHETAAKLEKSIPAVEWWDAFFLKQESYEGIDELGKNTDADNELIRRELATIYVQHPILVKPPLAETTTKPKELYLTKEERKKLRRQKRLEAEKEKQEKIRQGLMAPPAPKVKISNLMRVLGNEAIQDPTKVEADVRQQVAQRYAKHVESNQARKLTPEQRREKFVKKLLDERKKQLMVCVFRVNDLSFALHRSKVDKNANQYHLSGCGILFNQMNLVIVEGGPRALKRYKKVMLRRIKWNDTLDQGSDGEDEEEEDEEGENAANGGAAAASTAAASGAASSSTSVTQTESVGATSESNAGPKGPNQCVLVWEGMVKQPSFKHFRMKVFTSETQIREYLQKFRVEHYWDAAKNYVSASF